MEKLESHNFCEYTNRNAEINRETYKYNRKSLGNIAPAVNQSV